tara:strand:+ start:1249 stop:2097 length:849 start_codon:yes stop_codon:yes gene_type:complete
MKEELSLQEILNEVILFFINFRVLIISITLIGTFSVVAFQKLRPAYYSTIAIVTSGVSEFERLQDDNEVMNQRTAINLINNLQLDINKQDLTVVAKKLDMSMKDASLIKSISAEQIFNKDKDGKDQNTPKFTIELLVKDNDIITTVESGLSYLFNTNEYIKNYYNRYKITSQSEIDAIDEEIRELTEIRKSGDIDLYMSTMSLYAKGNNKKTQNQIIDLIQIRTMNLTSQTLLEPLTFVQRFSVTHIPERRVLILGSLAALISFILGTILAIFKNVYRNNNI